MTQSLSPSPPLSIDDCRQAGVAFGESMRGRSRQKFESALMRRIDQLVASLAETKMDEDEAVAAFDVAAWDAWEAVLGALAAPEPPAEPGRTAARPRGKG